MPNQPNRPKSTEEILREMEDMSNKMGHANSPQAEDTQPSGKSGGGLKSLLDFFIKVVPDEEQAPTATKSVAPPAPPNARPRVADLIANDPAPKFAAPSNDAADLSAKPFDEIYRAAGLTDSPCSVDELAKLMENPTIATQPMNVKVVAVNLTLSAKGISPEVPVTDAIRRDRALDAYQSMLGERAQVTEQRNQALIQQIAQETEAFLKRKQAEMDALRAESSAAKQQSLTFAQRREAEEQRLANLISPFLEGKPNPVSIGNQVPTPSPAETK
jgi:hypothetical protein